MVLGHALVGDGPRHVIVLHDWLGDHRNYDPMLAYLERSAFTYAFADVRGYGLSREHAGRYDLDEAAGDVRALAAALGWSRFDLVGHSMSSLIVQQVAAAAPEQVTALVVVTPVAPAGMQTPPAIVEQIEAVALDGARRERFVAMWGDRLSPMWRAWKLARWAEAARPEAVRGYVRMFAATALTGRPPLELPVLAVIGAHDHEPFTEATVRAGFTDYARLELHACASAGHYPMQETPVELATVIERFLRQ